MLAQTVAGCSVVDHRDGLAVAVDIAQIVGAVGSVTAIGMAALAIVRSDRQIVRERQIEFELNTLKELAMQRFPYEGGITAGNERFRAVAALLGPEIVPFACAAAGQPSTVKARQDLHLALTKTGVPAAEAVGVMVIAEILDAIDRRVQARR